MPTLVKLSAEEKKERRKKQNREAKKRKKDAVRLSQPDVHAANLEVRKEHREMN